MMASARDVVFIVGIAVLLPLCSIQHFIWPLSWCLLADICNHTWIPECGYDELMDSYRLFIDECDMFEYNCDHETDYEPVKYSDCFKQQMCPVANIPCPSRPTCPDHRYHGAGDKYIYLTTARRNNRRNMGRNGLRMINLAKSLPPKMLKGRRRYTLKRTKRKIAKSTPKIVIKRRKIARKYTRKANREYNPTRTKASTPPTRTKASTSTRTSRRVPTHTIIQSSTFSEPVMSTAVQSPSNYEVTNYSLCFSSMHLLCPKPKPCPSRPACPDHRYHRMGDRYVVLNPRRQGRRMLNPSGTTLSMKMMNGKRRYTPEKLKRLKRNRTHYILRTRRTTPLRTRPRGPPTKHTWSKKTIETLPTMTESIDINQRTTNEGLNKKTTSVAKTKSVIEITVVLKSETIRKNGKVFVKKIVKRIKKYGYEDNKIYDSDFIE